MLGIKSASPRSKQPESAAAYKQTFHFHASASSLGGFLDTPVHSVVPVQASASLPTAGGHACVEGGPFDHHNIVSCKTTFSRVSGKPNGVAAEDGASACNGWTTQTTCIVEGFNLLQVLSIERIVAQITVEHPGDGKPWRYSFAGSHFSGLRVGGKDVTLTLNPDLFNSVSGVTWADLIRIATRQAADLAANKAASQWAKDSMEWMLPAKKPGDHGQILCSLVNDVTDGGLGKSFAHYLEIPGVGKIFLAELMGHPHSVQLTMLRAELGCHVNGTLAIAAAHTGGGCQPPCSNPHQPGP